MLIFWVFIYEYFRRLFKEVFSISANMSGMTAVILAATELGGMGMDYFENRTRHLIPIIDNPLIFHLIDSIIFNEKIEKIYIIIEEHVDGFEKKMPCKKSYDDIINFKYGNNEKIGTFGQNFLTKAGTLEAIKTFINVKDCGSPLLILNGDTYIDTSYLNTLIDDFYKNTKDDEKSSQICWGIINCDNKRKGNIVFSSEYNADLSHPIKNAENFINIISETGIRSADSYIDTGILLFSRDAWENILLKIINILHRPSPLGLFSFASILKQALVFRGLSFGDKIIPNIEFPDIKIRCIIGNDESCYGVNYPWELLDLNGIIIKNKLKERLRNDREIKVVRNDDEFRSLIGKVPIKILNGQKIGYNINTSLIGPCYFGLGVKIYDNITIDHSFIGTNCIINSGVNIVNSKLEDIKVKKGAVIENCIIQRRSEICENTILRDSFLGEKCKLGNNASVYNSTLEKEIIIHAGSVIDNCILMEGTTIFHNCFVTRSIIGRYAMLGVGVSIPCRRLGEVDLNAKEKEPKQVIYFSDISISRVSDFGAVIGDNCQLGTKCIIYPGRKIGKRARIDAGEKVIKNYPPDADYQLNYR